MLNELLNKRMVDYTLKDCMKTYLIGVGLFVLSQAASNYIADKKNNG